MSVRQVDLLKDDLEEKEVLLSQTNKECRELGSVSCLKTTVTRNSLQEVKLLKRQIEGLQSVQAGLKQEIMARDQLIKVQFAINRYSSPTKILGERPRTGRDGRRR